MTSSTSEPTPVPVETSPERGADLPDLEGVAGTGTYVVLEVGGGRYGLDVDYVHGVVPVGPVTRVPGAGTTVRGVINVRGRILPLGDLLAVLDGHASPPADPAPRSAAAPAPATSADGGAAPGAWAPREDAPSGEDDPVMAVLLSLRHGAVPELALLGEVLDVVELDEERMEPPPPFGLGGATPLVTAVAHLGDGELTLVLHPGRLLAVLGVDGEDGE